ncbi:MAG: NAD(P)(+) transhydrogenase (Re/Si-specific) subunit beta [Frankiaceae bacterium]
MSATTLGWIYLITIICFVLALKGLSSPRTARPGNLLGAAGMLIAVIATFFVSPRLHHLPLMLVAMAIGTVIGVPAARQVPMTAIPQMVAIFNGVGGGAAAVVSIAEYLRSGGDAGGGVITAIVFSILVGCVSFTGSVLTFLKLQELMTGRPIVYAAQQAVTGGLLLVIVVGAVLTGTGNSDVGLVLLALGSLALGVALVLPVGGADVPVVISLLNSFTGLAVAASGFALKNTLLIVSGTLVGASGALLTRLMATAMGRSLRSIMFGALKGGSTAGSTAELTTDQQVRSSTADDIGVMLAYSQRVTIVPGYGLAVAQAQHTIRELVDLLEQRGVEVAYAIHPVAGRMPGHMNVLLAEANVPYEQLKEMDEVNPEFARTDVALVVGANDVVNPAARDEPGSPIYGMPILDVDQAKHVVFMKRSMRPGFAGIDNKLLYDPKTVLLFGDAKESLGKLVAAVKAS